MNEEIRRGHVQSERPLAEKPGQAQIDGCLARQPRETRSLGPFADDEHCWPRLRRDLPDGGDEYVEALDRHEPSGGEHRAASPAQLGSRLPLFLVRASIEQRPVERRRLDPAARPERATNGKGCGNRSEYCQHETACAHCPARSRGVTRLLVSEGRQAGFYASFRDAARVGGCGSCVAGGPADDLPGWRKPCLHSAIRAGSASHALHSASFSTKNAHFRCRPKASRLQVRMGHDFQEPSQNLSSSLRLCAAPHTRLADGLGPARCRRHRRRRSR